MRRLIYAPKAYIFIRSSNQGGVVYDVSADVTSGQVIQNLNDLSKATFTLRNRYRKWIRDPDTHQQIFLPMDMVTIWLQRVAGRPIQVFTGYLDAVPYYQAYPGDAIFEASCTLKKLAFSWFDPGLPFFRQWAISADGWQYTPDGEAINPKYLKPDQALTTKAGSGLPPTAKGIPKINDAGFDALLGRFLVEVAGWGSDEVLISDLPKNLPKLAARLYADVNRQTEQDLSLLEEALGQTMGINGWVSPDAKTTQTTNGPAQNSAVVQMLSRIRKRCDLANMPLLVCAFASYLTTNFDDAYDEAVVDPKNGVTTQLYGLYAMSANGQTTPVPWRPGGTQIASEPSIDGIGVSQIINDAETATDIFCKRMNQHPALVKNAKNTQNLANIQVLAEAALGRSLDTGADLQTAFTAVKQYCHAALISTTPNSQPAGAIDPGQLTWDDFLTGSQKGMITDAERQVIRNQYQKTKPWLSGILYRAKIVSPQITIVRPLSDRNFTSISLYGPPSAMANFLSTIKQDASIDTIDAIIDGHHYLFQAGVESNLNSTTNHNNTMVVTQKDAPASTASPTNSGGTSTKSTGEALAAFSANSAFAAQFAFPANQVESLFLTGNRALMNDVSCLDGVKQFCQASLRTFRSLPDGRFCAFYPDYFGATRQPYWQIYNIEITNFGIQLNDEALATHVYVVGDTFAADGQISMEDKISTRGVATITQAFMLNSFIEAYHSTKSNKPLTQPSLGRLVDAYSFLQHYGARPYEEDQPLIRNVFYEFLLAWQRFMQKWASQFATECTFTFQPEVMAGGLIKFPDHDIQMFCESVTHNWSYTDGFTTSATMTAPSLTPNKRTKDTRLYPGFALGGNINTVGS